MAQPPFAARVTNFLDDANAGLESPSPLGTDTELNALINVVNQVVLRLRAITESDGTLKNFAASTAQALAGVEDITATAAQTAFVTSILWTAAFTAENVFVFVDNTKLATADVAVADDGSGFLEVTIAAQAAGAVVTIAAFESGAGLLSRLQTISATEGASLIAINDIGGLFSAVEVEGALQEEATTRAALETAIGNPADLIRRTGIVPFTAAQSMGGFKLTDLADGVSAQDAVTVNQFNAYTAVWNALQAYFMRLDGTTTMGADLPMGAHKITGLATGVASTDAVNKAQIDLKISTDGTIPMAADLAMGGFKITGLAAGVAATDAVNVAQAQSLAASFATLTAYQAAGTFSFVVPAGISKIRVQAFGGGGGGMATFQQYGGGGGAVAEAVLSVAAGTSLTVVVGAGGGGSAAPTAGGNSTLANGATVLVTAGGGQNGASAGGLGAGGTYAFDASVTGFGISGMRGEAQYHDVDGAGHYGDGHGGHCSRGGFGGKGYTTGGGTSTYANGAAPGGGGGAGDNVGAGSGAAGAVLIWY